MRTAQLNISYQEDFKQNQLGERRAQVLVKTRACTILILSLVLFRLVLGIQQQFYKKMWTSAWFKLGWSDIRKRVRCQLDHHHHHVAKAYINFNPMKSHTRNRTYKRVFSQPNFWSKLFSIRRQQRNSGTAQSILTIKFAPTPMLICSAAIKMKHWAKGATVKMPKCCFLLLSIENRVHNKTSLNTLIWMPLPKYKVWAFLGVRQSLVDSSATTILLQGSNPSTLFC